MPISSITSMTLLHEQKSDNDRSHQRLCLRMVSLKALSSNLLLHKF